MRAQESPGEPRARARGPGLAGLARGPSRLFTRSNSLPGLVGPGSWDRLVGLASCSRDPNLVARSRGPRIMGPARPARPARGPSSWAQLVGPASLLSAGSKSGSASPWAQLVGPCYGPSSSVARGIQIWLSHTYPTHAYTLKGYKIQNLDQEITR